MQSRFKSVPLWFAVAGLVALVLKSWFQIEIPSFNEIVEAVIGVLVLFGILNNPQNKVGF